jgi:succinate-semialdehyde dehydrogenase/glutarate-semialdehyde dehydrogenase
MVTSKDVGALIADERVQAVTFVGSTEAGARVAKLSGQALKKSVLELGGSDPFIVLDDADVDLAARTAVNARYQNGGQDCIAAKRFIVVEPVADEFLDRLADAVAQLRVDDPILRTTQIGPMARGDLRDGITDQVGRSLAQGAQVIVGGQRLERRGYFYAPTVLANVTPGVAAFDEETFGPIAAVARAKDATDAIRLANHSPFGLGSSIWTRDVEQAKVLAREIEAGMVFVNGLVASDPRLPFGGVKRSGWGRELSEFGIREFVNIRTVWIGPARAGPAASS